MSAEEGARRCYDNTAVVSVTCWEATQQLQSEVSSLISVASRPLSDKQCDPHLLLKLRNISCISAVINLFNVQLKVMLQDAF